MNEPLTVTNGAELVDSFDNFGKSKGLDDLVSLIESWKSRQDIMHERTLACLRRLETKMEQQLTALSASPPGAAAERQQDSILKEAAFRDGMYIQKQPTGEFEPPQTNGIRGLVPGAANRSDSDTDLGMGDETVSPKGFQSSEDPFRYIRHSRTVKQQKSRSLGSLHSGRRTTLRKKANQYIIAKKRMEVMMSNGWLYAMTSSPYFEAVSSVLVILNAITTGWQVQYVAHETQATFEGGGGYEVKPPTFFLVIQTLFCLLFLAELMVRWIAEGLWDFFSSGDVGWNIFDICIVTMGIIEMILDLVVQGSMGASFSALRVLRVLRLVRLVRIIRVYPFFRELRMMIDSILGSLKSFLWAMLVLGMMFYMFGISLTSGVSAYFMQNDKFMADEVTPVLLLHEYFGTLDRTMLSLYQSMSGGRDWTEFYDVLHQVQWPYRFVFLLFVSFSIFAVVNVVTGVFVESAIKTSAKDHDLLIREELRSAQEYQASIQDIFQQMDGDDTGTLTYDEFEKHLDDDRVIAYFNTLKLDVSDARSLFKLLDVDESGSVEINEFVDGCQRLKGESRSLDIHLIRYELNALYQRTYTMADRVDKMPDLFEKALGRVLGTSLVNPHGYRHSPRLTCSTSDHEC